MSSDDEDVKRAIAESLVEYKASSHKEDPIVISSDDEEVSIKPSNLHPIFRKVPAATQDPATNTSNTAASSSWSFLSERAKDPTRNTSTSNTATSGTWSFLSERAQLEEARLERVKRMRESGSAPGSQPKPKLALEDPFVSSQEDEKPSMKKSKLSASASLDFTDAASSSVWSLGLTETHVAKGKGVEPASPGDQLFWSGELRQTANMYVDKTKDTRPVFRLTEILGNQSDLTFCILSSFVTQLSWVYSLLPPTLPVIFVAHPRDDGAASVHNVLPNWVKVTPEMKSGRGCMHIKFILLFYKTGRVRIVITTANLVDYDWRDIENSAWVHDISPRPHAIPRDPKADDFGTHFETVLDALNVREGLRALRADHPRVPLTSINDLWCRWDFSKIKAKLVASIPGKHESWPAVLKVGHTRLMLIVRQIGARADAVETLKKKVVVRSSGNKGRGKLMTDAARELTLECQTSSIGTYNPAWVDEFFLSAQGASPEAWLDEIKTRRAKDVEARVRREGWPAVKILFPSLNTVEASLLGRDGAGTMFCRRQQWNGTHFPRELFHDSNSRRGLVLMHSKMILATLRETNLSRRRKWKPKPKPKTRARPKPRPASSPEPYSSVTEFSSDTDSDIEEIDPERDSSVVGWAYVGSHNFTPSAWGTLSGSSFRPIINISNYELGIVFPLKDPQQANEIACWDRPPRKYDLTKDEPWIQNFGN